MSEFRDGAAISALAKHGGAAVVPFEFGGIKVFSEGEAHLIDWGAVHGIHVKGTATVERAIGYIKSVYEIESRGRHLTVCAGAGALELEVHIVQVSDTQGT